MAAVSGVSSVLRTLGQLPDRLVEKEPVRPSRPSTNKDWLVEVGWPKGHLGLNASVQATLNAKLISGGRLPAAAQWVTIQLPADMAQAAGMLTVTRNYFAGNSLTQLVRVEGTVSAAFLSALKPLCPNLRALDLSDCAFSGNAAECMHLLAHFNQLHELNVDLKTLSQPAAEAVLEALGCDVSSPLVTLRLFGCDRLDLVHRDAHRRLFALPQLRVLQFYQVASEQVAVGTRWNIVKRFQPEPFKTNGALLLEHRERPALPPIVPHTRNQIILPV